MLGVTQKAELEQAVVRLESDNIELQRSLKEMTSEVSGDCLALWCFHGPLACIRSCRFSPISLQCLVLVRHCSIPTTLWLAFRPSMVASYSVQGKFTD